jgi:hypothetical protein
MKAFLGKVLLRAARYRMPMITCKWFECCGMPLANSDGIREPPDSTQTAD